MPFSKIILTFCLFFSIGSFAQDYVQAPNIITPNGDGINDVFFVRLDGVEELSCTIINRYGEIIYRYFGVNGTWDGFTHAGVKVTAGTYFVMIKGVTEDGSIVKSQTSLQVQY
ncbi:MAG: T9SS type B sorting domain-containing protein [Crocinitomix sp.]|nr:T9SS type B sorting domain-containing protein [Crocinitomix sp.]